jgi:TetR/AcrR family transcriptional repressor of bet genes
MSVAADGAAGASLRAIVNRARISRGLVGYHFGSQASLLAAAFEHLCDDYRSMLGMVSDERPEANTDAETQLQTAIRRSFEWPPHFRERQYAWFGFWALARTDPALEAANREMYDEVARHLGALLATVAARRGRMIDAQAVGHELSATIDGAWLHLTTGVDGFTTADAIAMCRRCAERLLERDWDERARV